MKHQYRIIYNEVTQLFFLEKRKWFFFWEQECYPYNSQHQAAQAACQRMAKVKPPKNPRKVIGYVENL